MKWTLKGIVSKAVLIASVAIGCIGCSSSGRIHGTVTRQDGTPVERPRVGVRSQDTGKTAFTTAEMNGRFEFEDTFEPGVYDVVILEDLGDPDNRRKPTIAAKYREASKSGINVNVAAGETAELNLKLDPP